jgi:ApbE superfamily uncharacterized protein (UPF0280 family)
MSGGAVARMLEDGRRLHLHHGPIDLIIDAEGEGRKQALDCAWSRFRGLLHELVDELPLLRRHVDPRTPPEGKVARAMWRAALPHRPGFVTPMAAVAGAVAEEILGTMVEGQPGLRKAYVNNGGDIAFHLAPGAELVAAVAGGTVRRLRLRAADRARGIATSGWRGRSHSLGIADAVTVLAASAAAADVAATLLANAVDLPGHPSIRREPASALAPDSDLGARPVTVAVGALTGAETARALDRGEAAATQMAARGLIVSAALMLNGHCRIVGHMAPDPTESEIAYA